MELRWNDKQLFRSVQVQFITPRQDRKADGCDAGKSRLSGYFLRHKRCTFPVSSQGKSKEGDFEMLWTILVILLVLWLIGLLSNVGGSLIHLLLVVAVVVLVINLVTGRRAV